MGRCCRKMPCRKSLAVARRFHLLLAGRHGLVGEHLARIAMPVRTENLNPDVVAMKSAKDQI